MQRIASLLPSATEIACALGFESALVGRSHECDFPESVRELPILTAAKLDPDASSRVIDERVKELVSEGLSVYRVDADTLRDLAPTAILTQDHCEVCAASSKDLEAALDSFVASQPSVISLSPNTLFDVFNDIERVATALGEPERGEELRRQLELRLRQIKARVPAAVETPRVACLEWTDPLMGAGNWIPELVAWAGGRSVVGETGAHSPWLEWDELVAADPDVIVALPCGYDLARTRSEMAPLSARDGWSSLRAVRDSRVYLTDGNQYFNRPGPRLVESVQILSELLFPEACGNDLRGVGWEPL